MDQPIIIYVSFTGNKYEFVKQVKMNFDGL